MDTCIRVVEAKGEQVRPLLQSLVFACRGIRQDLLLQACLRGEPERVALWLDTIAPHFRELGEDGQSTILNWLESPKHHARPRRLVDVVSALAEQYRSEGSIEDEMDCLAALLPDDATPARMREGVLREMVATALGHLNAGRWPQQPHDLVSREDVDLRRGTRSAEIVLRLHPGDAPSSELLRRVRAPTTQ